MNDSCHNEDIESLLPKRLRVPVQTGRFNFLTCLSSRIYQAGIQKTTTGKINLTKSPQRVGVVPYIPDAFGDIGIFKDALRVLPSFAAIVKTCFPNTRTSMSRTDLCGWMRTVTREMVPCRLRQFPSRSR